MRPNQPRPFVFVHRLDQSTTSLRALLPTTALVPPPAAFPTRAASQHNTTTLTRSPTHASPPPRHTPRRHVSPPASEPPLLPGCSACPSILPRPIPPVTNQHRPISGSPLPRIPIPCRFRPNPRQGPRSPSRCPHHQRFCRRLHTQAVDVGTSLAQPKEEDQRHTHVKRQHSQQPTSTPTRPSHPDALKLDTTRSEYTASAKPLASVASIDRTSSQLSESAVWRLRAGGRNAQSA